MDSGNERSGVFSGAHSNTTPPFEKQESILNEMAEFVEIFVVFPQKFSVFPWRNDRRYALINSFEDDCILYDASKDPELFAFHPIPLGFEPVESGRCSPVLYSGSIADMIDYSLRSCVERGITVRRCKNCRR